MGLTIPISFFEGSPFLVVKPQDLRGGPGLDHSAFKGTPVRFHVDCVDWWEGTPFLVVVKGCQKEDRGVEWEREWKEVLNCAPTRGWKGVEGFRVSLWLGTPCNMSKAYLLLLRVRGSKGFSASQKGPKE